MTLRILFCLLISATLCGVGCQPSQQVETNKFTDAELRTIHKLKDERNTKGLLQYLKHENAQYREDAALALSSVGDGEAYGDLVKAFEDENNQDAQTAMALAIYHCGSPTEFKLNDFKRLTVKTQADAGNAANEHIWRAFGHLADSSSSAYLFNAETSTDSFLAIGQMRAAYEMALRGIISPKLIAYAAEAIPKTLPNGVHKWAAFTLYRCYRMRQTDFQKHEQSILNAVKNHPSHIVRTRLANCVQGTKSQVALKTLLELVEKDADYRVKIAAIQALTPDDYKTAKYLVDAVLMDANPNLSLSAAQFFAKCGIQEDAKGYLLSAKNLSNWRTRLTMVGAALKYGTDTVKVSSIAWASQQLKRSESMYERSEICRMLSINPAGFPVLQSFFAVAKTPLEKAVCLEGMAKIAIDERYANLVAGNSKFNFKNTTLNLLINEAKSDDEHVAYVAAQYLRHKGFDASNQVINTDFIAENMRKWSLPQYYETRLEFEKTARFFKGEEYEKLKLNNPKNNPTDFDFLAAQNVDETLTFKTTKGDVDIRFFINDAPGTAGYILKLAKDGFYNGKNFHRVVPNFVAQGGCPRGDGVGATDKSLRSEFSFREYGVGAVGMASAGKDTESCQLFITHTAVPHLTGRYTVFAQVVKGMNVVHQLEMGDKIVEVVSPSTVQNNTH